MEGACLFFLINKGVVAYIVNAVNLAVKAFANSVKAFHFIVFNKLARVSPGLKTVCKKSAVRGVLIVASDVKTVNNNILFWCNYRFERVLALGKSEVKILV